MEFVARARFIRFSPNKMRPLVNTLRGKSAAYAVNWLTTCAVLKSVPIKKMIKSAVDNAKSLHNISDDALFVKTIQVDRGPIINYFKPGAMGRSNPYRKRLCHMSVILESREV